VQWLLLVLSLPTENATVRMRAWRALRAAGAAVLRDGVHLLPERDDCRSTVEGSPKMCKRAVAALVKRKNRPMLHCRSA
jgi:DNA-binding transcriptional regulator PaaX